MTTPETAAEDAPPTTATYDVAIVGAGYVGLPLAQVFAEAGRRVVLLDVDAERVAQLLRGESYIEDVSSDTLAGLVTDRGLHATTDYDVVRDADAILIALPTPLSKQREPDLTIVRTAGAEIGKRLRPGHLVVLESTTYPGTTRDELQPILERESGLVAGKDFLLAFSPERVDPGRVDRTTKTVPKVVGGIDEASTEAAAALYGSAVDTIHRVSSPEAAELTKLLENIFRSVNIALVNELAQLCDRMGIDIWEVVDAAATKPFGFMPSTPAPASAATASRSTPSTSRGRRASSTSRRGSSSSRARSTRTCRTTAGRAYRRRSTTARASPLVGREGPRPRGRLQVRHRRLARVAGGEADRAAAQRGRDRRLPRPSCAGAPDRRHPPALGPARAGDVRRGRDRHRALGHRLRAARRRGDARRGPPQRHRVARGSRARRSGSFDPRRPRGRRRVGKNVLRVVGELAELAWICDIDEARRAEYAGALPAARG